MRATKTFAVRVARPLLAVLLVAGSASAQSTKLSASELDGRARFEEGVRLAQAGDHEHARAKFAQAWMLLKYSSVLFNLARAEQLSGHDVDALRHYRQFAKSSDPKITAAQREQADASAAELVSKVGQLAIEAPAGAMIVVDGERVEGDLADPVPVAAGTHVVEASFGGKTKRASASCAIGATAHVSLVEAPSRVEAPAAPAPLVAVPGARDGRHRSYILPGALAVAGLAGLGLGIGFSLASQSAKTDAERLGKPLVCVDRSAAACTSYVDAHDRVHADATVAWVGYIAGGALLAGALGTFLFWPRSTKQTRMHVVPIVGPGTAAAMATYAF